MGNLSESNAVEMATGAWECLNAKVLEQSDIFKPRHCMVHNKNSEQN